MSFTLHPHQLDTVDRVRQKMREGYKRILVVAPTGSGKTVIAVYMLGTAQAKGNQCLFSVHRRELVHQSCEAFETVGIPYGVIASGFPGRADARIQVGSIQTLAKRSIPTPRLIVPDEAHHFASLSWSKFFSQFPDATIVGLTATPQRLDGKGLGKYFDVIVEGPSTRWLIDNGYLCPYRMFSPPGVSVQGIKTEMGDYAKVALAAAVDKPTITGDVIAHYKKHALGRRAVCFAVSVEHSKHVVAQFNAAGIPAAHCDGETNPGIRDGIVADLKRGALLVVSNVDLFGEGFDLPAIEACIMLRPTKSLAMYLQQVGRALRTAPGKVDAVLLDHAGNVKVHGLPDEPREWSLEGEDKAKARAKAEAGGGVRVCPRCFAAQLFATQCRFCGEIFPARAREVEHVKGELEEINPGARVFDGPKTKRELTEAQLWAMAKSKGMKDPGLFVRKVLANRLVKEALNG